MSRLYWRITLPGVAAATTLLLMLRSAIRDPGATGTPGDLPNLHNRPGDLSLYSALVVIEVILALLILRPSTYHYSWRRSAFAALLFLPWFLLSFAMIVHSGGIMVIHMLWLFAVVVTLTITAGMSSFRAAAHRFRSRT